MVVCVCGELGIPWEDKRNITPVSVHHLLLLHSADAPASLEVFFLQECRSHTDGPVGGNGQSSPRVHQIRSSSAVRSFDQAGYLEELQTTIKGRSGCLTLCQVETFEDLLLIWTLISTFDQGCKSPKTHKSVKVSCLKVVKVKVVHINPDRSLKVIVKTKFKVFKVLNTNVRTTVRVLKHECL